MWAGGFAGVFTLPTNGSQIAAANFDETGTTKLGTKLVDHSFILPVILLGVIDGRSPASVDRHASSTDRTASIDTERTRHERSGTPRFRHRRLGAATSCPTLHDYIRIPNVSPVFEEDWAELGHMRAGGRPARRLGRARPIPGLTLEIHEIEGLTPVIFMEIPPANGGSADDTVLLYGHLDKQPELFGWREGLGPWEPVIEGDRLYGRGGADDGYSTFASLTCDRGGAGSRASRTPAASC